MTQRVRLTFSATGPLQYVAHLDMMRTWERAIRRAGLPLVYTQGFSPHARMSLAAPLPVGVMGERELLDLWLDPAVAPAEVEQRLGAAMPPGMTVVAAAEVPAALPSLQSLLLAARYAVPLPGAADLPALRARVGTLLAREALDWEETRGEKTRRYDLRATILDLALCDPAPGAPAVLEMHLSLEEGRTGRPQQVLRALGIDDDALAIARTTLELREDAFVAEAGAAGDGADRGAT